MNATSPSPVPLVPEVIVTQGALLVAVQMQPEGAVTDTFPLHPCWKQEIVFSLSEMKHESLSFWNTENATVPLMTMNPVRSPEEFGATEKLTVPLPVPVPEEMVIHALEVKAVQWHAEVVLTLKVPAPPPIGKNRPDGLSE